MEHHKPWVVKCYGCFSWVRDKTGDAVFGLNVLHKATAEHIVACVNAFHEAGIEPADLPKLVEAVRAAWNDPTPAGNQAPQAVQKAMRLAAACLTENRGEK